jgi:hypothetical protein
MTSRRRLRTLLVFLLLGAIANVAVAIAAAVFLNVPGSTSVAGWLSTDQHQYISGWDCIRGSSTGVVRLVAYPRKQSMLNQMDPSRVRDLNDPDHRKMVLPWWSDWDSELRRDRTSFHAQLFDARGWPLPTLEAHWFGGKTEVDLDKRWRWGISLSSSMARTAGGYNIGALKAVPLRPIWPNFFLNTLFYAALLWLLLAFPFILRRFLRLKRGLCPKCAYPVGTSDVCTECGGVVALP